MNFEEAKGKAFEYGKNEGKPAGEALYEMKGEVSEEDFNLWVDMSLDGLVQGAEYFNVILPKLREWVGYEDSGTGTYRENKSDEKYYEYNDLVDIFIDGFFKGFKEGYEEQLED